MYALLERRNVQKVDVFFRFRLITSDPDDDKFTDCAIASNARYIVSEDRHFAVLDQIDFPKVSVIGIDRFLEEIVDRPPL